MIRGLRKSSKDGMNRIGIEGRGESVWLGWFLYATLMSFAPVCELMNDDPAPYRQQAERLLEAVEAHTWDGSWYRRAYYDDGTPLGAASGYECKIDAIAQAWSVLSGAAPRNRAEIALDEAVTPAMAAKVRAIADVIQQHPPAGTLDVVPSFASVAVFFEAH